MLIKITIALFVISFIRFTSSFELTLPDYQTCPETYLRMDYCRSKYTSCIWNLQFCTGMYCECVKNEQMDDGKCNKFISSSCHNLEGNNRDGIHEEGKQMFEIPHEAKHVMEDVVRSCDVKNNAEESSITLIKKVNDLLKTQECGAKFKPAFDKNITSVDQETSTKLAFPFSHSYCGWQLDYPGRVIFRRWMSNACGINSIDLNHCCARHFNCHLLKKKKKEDSGESCDEELQACNKKQLGSMKSFKKTCEDFVNKSYIENEQSFQEDIKTQLQVFNGYFHEPISESETKFGITTIPIIELAPDHSFDPDIRVFLNDDILKHGWSHRIVISSCFLKFEEGRLHDKLTVCLKTLLVCLNDFEDQTETYAAQQSILDDKLTALVDRERVAPTKAQVLKMIEDNQPSPWWNVLVVLDLLFTVINFFAGSCLRRKFEECFGRRTMEAEAVELEMEDNQN